MLWLAITPMVGAVTGVLAAGRLEPLVLGWKARPHPMRARVALLGRPAIGRARRGLGAAAVGLILAGGALAAYAAEPSAPEQLPKEVVGVVGSGDQLSLEVRAAPDAPVRTVRVGEEYKDGWTLKALSDATAVLAKDGQSTAVGLNPSGVVAQALPVGAPSTVNVDGMLSPAETQRLYELKAEADDLLKTYTQAPGFNTLFESDLIKAMGADGAEYAQLDLKQKTVQYQKNLALYQALTAERGDDVTLYVPKGTLPPVAFAAAGLQDAPMRFVGADASGGETFRLAAPQPPVSLDTPPQTMPNGDINVLIAAARYKVIGEAPR